MTHSFSTCAAKTGPPTITHASAIAMVTSGSSGRHASSCRYAPGRGCGKDHLFMGQVVQVSSTPLLNVRTHLCYLLYACAVQCPLGHTCEFPWLVLGLLPRLWVLYSLLSAQSLPFSCRALLSLTVSFRTHPLGFIFPWHASELPWIFRETGQGKYIAFGKNWWLKVECQFALFWPQGSPQLPAVLPLYAPHLSLSSR